MRNTYYLKEQSVAYADRTVLERTIFAVRGNPSLNILRGRGIDLGVKIKLKEVAVFLKCGARLVQYGSAGEVL